MPCRIRYEAAVNIGFLYSRDIMAIERTFSILKPDATQRNLTGAINALIEKAGLRIVAQKRVRMTREQAETFYAGAPIFRQARRNHDGRTCRCASARSRGRDQKIP